MSHDSSSIEIEVLQQWKLTSYFSSSTRYKCAGILLTSVHITQRVLTTPTLIGT